MRFFAFFFVFFVFAIELLGGTSSTGGGGSAIRCERDGKSWAELTDFWEALYLEKLDLFRTEAPVTDQLSDALERLKIANLLFYRDVVESFQYVNANKVYLPPPYGLKPPPDVNPIFDIPGCVVDGYMYYDGDRQMVYISQKNDELLVSNSDRAGGIIHEAIYKSFRDLYKDTNSVRTRRLVGWLFSKQSIQDVRPADSEMSNYLICRGNQAIFFLKKSFGSPATKRDLILLQLGALSYPQGLKLQLDRATYRTLALQPDFLSRLAIVSYRLLISEKQSSPLTYNLEIWDPTQTSSSDEKPNQAGIKIFQTQAVCQ